MYKPKGLRQRCADEIEDTTDKLSNRKSTRSHIFTNHTSEIVEVGYFIATSAIYKSFIHAAQHLDEQVVGDGWLILRTAPELWCQVKSFIDLSNKKKVEINSKLAQFIIKYTIANCRYGCVIRN